MSGSRFQLLLDKAMAETASALLSNPPGNPDKDTMLKSKHQTLVQVKQMYREATQTMDDDGDKV